MIIQIAIIGSLLLILIYAYTQQKRSPLISMLLSALVLVGIFLTIFPQTLTALATLLGVGRGVDLMFYIVILAAFLAIINLHIRIRSLQDSLRDVSRAQALSNPRQPGDPVQ